MSETLFEKITNFKQNRISNILSNDTPIPVNEGSKTVLHIIPINAFYSFNKYIIETSLNDIYQLLNPIYPGPVYRKYTIDGFLAYDRPNDNKTESYVHLYRSGIIEAVSTALFNDEYKKVSQTFHEEQLTESMTNYLNLYKQLNVEMPIFIFLTLMHVKGFSMEREDGIFSKRSRDYFIAQDILFIPEIFIEKEESDIKNMLKPIFDSIYNACGYERSINYP